MRNLTTAIIVENSHLPDGGLRQDQLRFDRPLHYMDVVHSPAGGLRYDAYSKVAARHFVAAAIQYLHPSAVHRVFGDGFEERFAAPTIDVLPPRKTPVHLLSAMFENEATVSGTARVHVELFLKQLGLGRAEGAEGAEAFADVGNAAEDDAYLDTAPEFTDELFLAYGDQMTAARIRGVKFGQRSARRAFDRRDWLLGPPVWFHTLQAVLHLIIRTHWETLESGQFSRATLVHDIAYLDRHGISKDNFKYHQIQPLVTQGFRARVSALFYRSMQKAGALNNADLPVNTSAKESREVHERYFDTYDRAVQMLTTDEFDAHVDAVCDRALSRGAWLGKDVEDLEFVTMCRFLQEMLLFLQLQRAVKFGDIGVLRRLVDPLAVVFLGGNQHLYGFEMLHLHWLLTHADPALQRAVLACGLVNERGRPDTFKPVDLVLEHANLQYAEDMKKLKNSTHDVIHTFIRGSLAHDELRRVRAAFELNSGVRIDTSHSYKRAEGDVFNLAVFLHRERCTEPGMPSDRKRLFLSRDLYSAGVELLPIKVLKFNADMIQLPGSASDALRLALGEDGGADGEGGEEGGGDELEAVDSNAAEVHESVLDALTIADRECYLDADVGQALERHMEAAAVAESEIA